MWTPDPAIIISAEQKAAQALESLQEQFRVAIQSHVDAVARGRRYDSGVLLASYVASTDPIWSTEAQAFVAWRDAVWSHTYVELDKVLAGARPQPTVEDFIAELPALTWPE